MKTKEEMKEYKSKYYQDNKDRYHNYYKEKFPCEVCGVMITRNHIKGHQMTAKHIKNLEKQNEAVPVDNI